MNDITINNSSDIGITCVCGLTFTGKAMYWKEISNIYNIHVHSNNLTEDKGV